MTKPLHQQEDFLVDAINFTVIGVQKSRQRLARWNQQWPGPIGEAGRQGRRATLAKGLRLLRHLQRLRARA